jgi:N2-acetyl-L-2,4-diaminobutanoate deacetylase
MQPTHPRISEHEANTDNVLECIRLSALESCPRLLVLGAVHGNETCGPAAIHRALADCRSGRLAIRRGSVTFVPVANPKAFRQRTREGERNLNRDLRERNVPVDYEDRIGNRLCALMREHDILLDLHSFRSKGEPFVFLGPQNNDGTLEPFRHAEAEGSFAAILGPSIVIHGWLENYARFLDARAHYGYPRGPVSEGRGTTEYMRAVGGFGVTVECGSHDDPNSVEVAYAAIVNALSHLGLVDGFRPARAVQKTIRIVDVLLCISPGDALASDWKNGEPVAMGKVIARRANGTLLKAPSDGFIVFPNGSPTPGDKLCYFGVLSDRQL